MISKLIHKKMLLCGILLLVAVMLAACGEANENKQVNRVEADATPTSEAETTAPEPRTFTDALGRSVELPADPERIVAHYYASEMTALGIPMIGTNYQNAQLVLSEEQLKGIEDIGGEGTVPNMEKVLSVSPDLIIVPDFLEIKDIDSLTKIAPTVAISYSGDVFSRLRTLAEIMGKPELAEGWITQYNAKAEAKKAELGPFMKEGETASAFIVYLDKQLYLYGPQRLGPTMYDALGFVQPPKVAELFNSKKDSLWETISLEALPDYAGDRIFLMAQDNSEEAKQIVEEIINGPIWSKIPAVQNGHAYIVDKRWGLNDPLTLDFLLDEMTSLLTKE
ncbi:ABC transporter substrate-binding protein [Paenibacillus sinopodophylli]|uniref:ABC transporter substrate-binding protein n=1 Tax=Paenibacillus sinopodophylli TaxID=1837342 RepID=UPI0014872C31|nr:ABC transporter substrate-binding protein [Paenibacillus sinopodophylli]